MRRLALKVILEECNTKEGAGWAGKDVDEHYSSNKFPCFKAYLEEEMSENYLADYSVAREVVTLLDQARGRQIEVTWLFLSALAGGLAAALVSVLMH
jgi:hypothetical protein